jgi:phage terminase Nu1 subunit (DNA packaging protein)
MKKEDLENIIKEQKNLKNLPNTILVEYMDLLSTDFDFTKNNIIQQTYYLDKVEELYNNVLNVYEERKNATR